MGFVEQLGEMALVSRMRRLVDRMHQDNTQIFREHHIPFETRWFLILNLLDEEPAMSIMEIAKALGITHPTVNQFADELMKLGYVASRADAKDKRRRLLSLTPAGHTYLESLKPLWQDMHAAAREVVQDTGIDIIAMLSSIEAVLDAESYYSRIRRHMNERLQASITIEPYTAQYQGFVKALQSQWIEAQFSLETADNAFLNKPSGHLWVACIDGTPVGSCALDKTELQYLAVDPAYQGKGVGRKLIETVLTAAREQGAQRVTCGLNHQQTKAMNVLRQAGFRTSSAPKTYSRQRHDVLMSITLS